MFGSLCIDPILRLDGGELSASRSSCFISGEIAPVLIGYETGWSLEPVWAPWREILPLLGLELWPFSRHLIASHCAGSRLTKYSDRYYRGAVCTSIHLYIFMAWCLMYYVQRQLYRTLSIIVLRPTRYEPTVTGRCSEQNGNVFSLNKNPVKRKESCSVPQRNTWFMVEARDIWRRMRGTFSVQLVLLGKGGRGGGCEVSPPR
jgi:hypothetical protein